MSTFSNIKFWVICLTHIVCGMILYIVLMGRLVITHGPKSFFRVKKRNTRPNCMTNPKLGIHKYIETEKDVKLHYVESGDPSKPLMILIHGFPDCWYTWREQIIAFQKYYWVIAVDSRGCGESDKPPRRSDYTSTRIAGDIKSLVTKLGRRSCVLVGHDWGGIVCWEFGTLFPEVVDKLIILNAPHPNIFFNTILNSWAQRFKSLYMFFFQIPWIPEFVMRWNDYALFARSTKIGKTSFYSDEEVEALKYALGRPGTCTASLNYYRANLYLMHQRRDVTCPTVVIWGIKDRYLSPVLLDGLNDFVTKLKIEKIENAGHWVQHEESVRVNQLVLQHLQENARL